nr:unnamed protein product [Callosobruchus analis]
MLELLDILNRRRARKRYRERINHFEKWNDEEFRQRFRLSKNHAVSAEIMLLVTLRYLATGSFLVVVGDFVGIDKSTACRIVYKVCRAIAGLHTTFIRMPVTDDEAHINSNRFYNIARFPRCIGAIDCTHVRISSLGGNQPEIFRNRKNFFSFNVQAISDAELKIQNIMCRWPGSAHDTRSFIFNNSNIRAKQLQLKGGWVAQWLELRSWERKVPGSNLARNRHLFLVFSHEKKSSTKIYIDHNALSTQMFKMTKTGQLVLIQCH